LLRDYVLALWAVPLADVGVTPLISADNEPLAQFAAWLQRLQEVDTSVRFDVEQLESLRDWMLVRVDGRERGVVGVTCLRESALHGDHGQLTERLISDRHRLGADIVVAALAVDETDDELRALADGFAAASVVRSAEMLVMEPRWLAALTVERLKPLLIDNPMRLGTGSPVPYFEIGDSSAAPAGARAIEIGRVVSSPRSLASEVVDDTGLIRPKLREAQSVAPYAGTVMLCTTFLPPVTQSLSAQLRFYERYGSTPEALAVVKERMNIERDGWREHIETHRRIDIIDRGQVDEYLAAPEYFQMPLKPAELEEQLRNFDEMLAWPNYELCLTPEAVDLPFEIRGTEVRVRTDRRNKGEPRQGRIRNLTLREPAIVESFEREFWTLYRHTEAQFKDKGFIREWVGDRMARYKRGQRVRATTPEQYDVFLCHNSEDKPQVKRIARRLQKEGISVWLNEWHAPPGRPWIYALEEQLEDIATVAAFVGSSGIGPWQKFELAGYFMAFVERGCPIFPVILKDATAQPEIPPLLKMMTWIDFRKRSPNAFATLARAIRSETA
jgi:hypothetical protein